MAVVSSRPAAMRWVRAVWGWLVLVRRWARRVVRLAVARWRRVWRRVRLVGIIGGVPFVWR